MKDLLKVPSHADDAHDIALLEDYDRRFTEMIDEMETELEKMHAAGTLTTEFERNVHLIMSFSIDYVKDST